MGFDEEDLREFRIEAHDMIDDGEQRFLAIEKGEDFSVHYDAIFRLFHSLKGGAGMLGLLDIQTHMHKLEELFLLQKGKEQISSDTIAVFLKALDVSRAMLRGESVKFSFADVSKGPPSASTLPAAVASRSLQKEAIEPLPGVKRSVDGSHGLVYAIDDEVFVLESIKDCLQLAGYECKTFLTPEPLFNAIKETPPEVVLSDMKMPDLTGLEVLETVKKIAPDVPVVFVSGFLDVEALLRAIDLGVYSAIEKPFDNKTLVAIVYGAIKENRLFKLLNKSINLVVYQFSDLDEFLAQQGKEEIRKVLKREVMQLLADKRNLKSRKQLN